jgi:AcrR family transcriptional regulator
MVFWGAEMKPKYNKLTLSELAKKCGVSKQSIEKFFSKRISQLIVC